jgi:hypothetical protein
LHEPSAAAGHDDEAGPMGGKVRLDRGTRNDACIDGDEDTGREQQAPHERGAPEKVGKASHELVPTVNRRKSTTGVVVVPKNNGRCRCQPQLLADNVLRKQINDVSFQSLESAEFPCLIQFFFLNVLLACHRIFATDEHMMFIDLHGSEKKKGYWSIFIRMHFQISENRSAIRVDQWQKKMPAKPAFTNP